MSSVAPWSKGYLALALSHIVGSYANGLGQSREAGQAKLTLCDSRADQYAELLTVVKIVIY
jgi:hypothetical protein